MPRFLRPLLAVLVALGLLGLADAALQSQVGPPDSVPMPFREGASGFGPHGGPPEAEVVRALPDGGWQTRMHGQRLSVPKDPTVRRIVVLGESAVAGGGLPFDQTFPARLEGLLDSTEVINLGAPARDSAQVASLLTWALDHAQPDLVVVYCGNNEFHRLRAYRHFHPGWSSGWERLRLALQRLALYRWLAAARPAVSRRTLELPLEDLEVSVEPGDVALVTQHYRTNLEAMARACRARGVPLLLCTVAVNDLFPPGWGRGPDPEDVAVLEAAERLPLAERLPALQAAVRSRPSSAWRHYAWGAAALEAGEAGLARTELALAGELNPRPDRALPSFAGVVAQVAAAEGALLVDVEAALRQHSEVLGHEHFSDACHLTAEGNRVVAEALAAACSRESDPRE